MRGTLVLLLAGGLVVALLYGLNGRASLARNPSMILISVDSLRADHVDAYRSEASDPALTPSVNGMARNGVLFEHAYCQAAWTFPSHASMLSGRYPESIPIVRGPSHVLPEGPPFLASLLADGGYQAAAFTGGGLIAGRYGFDRGFSVYGELAGFPDTFRAASEWLEHSRDPGRPFFLFLHGYDVHPPNPDCPDRPPYDHETTVVHDVLGNDPLIGQHVLDDVYYQKLPATPRWFIVYNDATVRASGKRYHPVHLTPRMRAHLRAHYAHSVHLFDARLGAFLRRLDALGVSKDTVVMLVSDHGWDLFDHGYFSNSVHGFNSIAHVPLIVTGPGFSGGRRVSAAVGLVDITPTILALARRPRPSFFQGRSVLPLLMGSEEDRVAVTSMTIARDLHVWGRGFELLVGASPSLYSWKDEGERYDLSGNGSLAPIVEHLTAGRARWEDIVGPTRQPVEWTAHEDEEEREFLRRFGY